jgi:hypothetical protein
MGVPKVVRQNTEQWNVVSIWFPAWVGAQQGLDVWGQKSKFNSHGVFENFGISSAALHFVVPM